MQDLQYDAVLVSPPSKFVAPNVAAQADCLAEVLRHCPDTPAFYYHYPIVYRDDFDLIELYETAQVSCPTLCGCKLSGYVHISPFHSDDQQPPNNHLFTPACGFNRTPVEDVIRLGNYKPDKYSVITTGDANIMRSLELPAIRGAICYSQEAPLYHPLLATYAAGDTEHAKELAAHIGKGRAVTSGLNGELAVVPPASPTAVSVPVSRVLLSSCA